MKPWVWKCLHRTIWAHNIGEAGASATMRTALLIACAIITSFVLAQRPNVADGGILNGASFARGQPVARGSIVSIFGSELASGLSQASSIPLSTTGPCKSISRARNLFEALPLSFFLGTMSQPLISSSTVPA